jgi:hypothetical protein
MKILIFKVVDTMNDFHVDIIMVFKNLDLHYDRRIFHLVCKMFLEFDQNIPLVKLGEMCIFIWIRMLMCLQCVY